MKYHSIHFIIALALTIASIVGYVFWYSAISAKSAFVAGIQEQIIAKAETMNRISSAREALSEIASDESLVQSHFVPEDGIVAFIDVLQGKGRAQGVVINILSVSKSEGDKRPSLSLSLKIAGAFDAVMRTIGAIEYAPYDLSISEFSISQVEKNNWSADVKIIVGSVSNVTATP